MKRSLPTIISFLFGSLSFIATGASAGPAQCALMLNGSNAWNVLTAGVTGLFRDRQAYWISTEATQNSTYGYICPQIPSDKKIVIESTFSLAVDTKVYVEAIFDDNGSLYLLGDYMGAQKFELSAENFGYAAKTFILPAGNYVVHGEAWDTWAAASGIAISIKKENGGVIKRTLGDNSWDVTLVNK